MMSKKVRKVTKVERKVVVDQTPEKTVEKEYEKQGVFLSDLEKEEDDLLKLIGQMKKKFDEQNNSVKHYQKEIASAVTDVEKETIKIKSSSSLTKEMILASLLPATVKPLRGIAAVAMNAVVTTVLIMDMLSFEEERTIETVTEVEDLTTDLISAIDDIKEIEVNIEKGIGLADDLLSEITKKFSDYKHTKEYNDLLSQIDDIHHVLNKNKADFQIVLSEQETNLKTNENQLKLVKK